MYYQDASWLDTAGRLLIVAFFLAVGLRNLQKVHIEDHVKRLTTFKAPFPKLTFWIGQAMEFVGCALVLFNWHPAVGVVLLLVFTVVASATPAAVLGGPGPDAHRHAERHACQYRHRRRPAVAAAKRALMAMRRQSVVRIDGERVR